MDEWLEEEVHKRMLGTSLEVVKFFTDDVIEELGREFSISPEELEAVQWVLEVGAHQWERETAAAKIKSKVIRHELDKLRNAIVRLSDTFDRTSDDTWNILADSGVWRSVIEEPLPRVIHRISETENGSSRTLEFLDVVTGEVQKENLDALGCALSALAECAVSAKLLAGAGRRGRPEDEAMFYLFYYVYQVWVSVLKRPFTLDWTKGNEPITDAARYCTRVCHIISAQIPAEQIVSSARKAREMGIQINNLQEVVQVFDHYRKQIE